MEKYLHNCTSRIVNSPCMANVISETVPLKGNGLCPRSCNLEIARMNSWCHSFRPSDWQPVSSIWWDQLCKIGKRLYPGKKYMLLPWFECPIFPFPGFHHRNSLIQINRGASGRGYSRSTCSLSSNRDSPRIEPLLWSGTAKGPIDVLQANHVRQILALLTTNMRWTL
jgi:hypothetical protein